MAPRPPLTPNANPRFATPTEGIFAPDRGNAATKEPCAAGAQSGGFVVPFLP